MNNTLELDPSVFPKELDFVLKDSNVTTALLHPLKRNLMIRFTAPGAADSDFTGCWTSNSYCRTSWLAPNYRSAET